MVSGVGVGRLRMVLRLSTYSIFQQDTTLFEDMTYTPSGM